MDRRQAKAVYPIMCFEQKNDAGCSELDRGEVERAV